jgi:hypothetical protein
VKSGTAAFLDKACKCLEKADGMLDRWPGEAGREAYLAGPHAAQALIGESAGKIRKRHRNVRSELACLTKRVGLTDGQIQAEYQLLKVA